MDGVPVRYRYQQQAPAIPMANQLIALNQSRINGGGGGVPSPYQLLDVLHEEEESVASPNAQLVENQQQLEQLNLHQHGFGGGGGGNCGAYLRCIPPSIVITDAAAAAKHSHKGGPVSGPGGAIAMR